MPHVTLPKSVFNEYLEYALEFNTMANDRSMNEAYEVTDIHPDAIAQSKADCLTFIEQNEFTIHKLITKDSWPLSRIINDFYLVRSGAGLSYSDRPTSLKLVPILVTVLDNFASRFSNPNFFEQDGKIHLSSGEPLMYVATNETM